MTLRRGFLYALITSVAVSALLGIIALLVGNLGWLEVRILLTTLTVAVASIAGLACGTALETGRLKSLAQLGILLTGFAASMLLVGIWLELGGELFWKAAVLSIIFSVAIAHTSLLSLANLAKPYAWLGLASRIAIFLTAFLLAALIVFGLDGDFTIRLIGVASILVASFTVMTPIFHRLSRDRLISPALSHAELETINREIAELKTRINELEAKKRGA